MNRGIEREPSSVSTLLSFYSPATVQLTHMFVVMEGGYHLYNGNSTRFGLGYASYVKDLW